MTRLPDQPERLYLFQLATTRTSGGPVPAYLIQTRAGKNILIDSGWSKDPVDAAKHPFYQGVDAPEEEDILHQLARLGLQPQDIHLLICTHFDPDHAGNHDLFPNAQLQEDRFYFLLPRAYEYVEQLIDEFSHETDPGLRYWLLELLAHRIRNELQRETVSRI